MPSEQLVLEEFFETKFAFDVSPRSHNGGASFFDGFVFWRIFFDIDKKFLFFSCDIHDIISAFPILEVGVSYLELRVSDLTGVCALVITTTTGSPFMITKTKEKRFSLATQVGAQVES